MTRGDNSSAERADFATIRRRTIASDASTPRATVMKLDNVATMRLVRSAWISDEFDRNCSYQRRVKPDRGNEITTLLLKEKITSIAIGAYRNRTRSVKKARSARTPFREV